MILAHPRGGVNVNKSPTDDRAYAVTVVVRAQFQRSTDATKIEGDDAIGVFRQALDFDIGELSYPIIQVLEGSITILDVDTHDWSTPPNDDDLEAVAASIYPRPDLWWVSHGKGLKLVFTGPDHEIAAGVAALSIPSDFTVEMKRDTRHPAGDHPDRPGAKCGPVRWNENARVGAIDWKRVGVAGQKSREQILGERGLTLGERYDHDKCPIEPEVQTTAKGCVQVHEWGLYCFRCADKGRKLADDLKPGCVPYSALGAGGSRSAVVQLAKNLVHWHHARLHLAEAYPHVPGEMIEMIYHNVLLALHGVDDPRVSMVFNPDLCVVQGEAGWHDAKTLVLQHLTNDTFDALPCMYRIERRQVNDQPVVDKSLRRPLRDRAAAGLSLPGYKPIRPVRGISLSRDRDYINVEIQPDRGDRVRLLSGAELLSEGEAFEKLAAAFPGISREYLKISIAARVCADRGGRPPIILSTGPTGSGKGQTVAIAASFCGQQLRKVELDAESDEKLWRSLGMNCAAGHQFLYIDEAGKLRKPTTLVRRLLEISNQISFRRLYESHEGAVAMRAAIFLPTSSMPEAFAKSPEFCRRCRFIRLYRTTPEWRDTCGGDAAEWRGRSRENAQVANNVLTHTYLLCAAHDFRFDAVADELGLTRPDDSGTYLDIEAARDLYRHCRGEDRQRQLHTKAPYRDGSWVNGNSPRCRELLAMFYTDDSAPGDLFWQLRPNVESLAWNQLLEIDKPNIVCELRKHGSLLAVRFREACAMRGKGRRNEELPPIPDSGPGGGPGNNSDSVLQPILQGQTPFLQKGCQNGGGRNTTTGKSLEQGPSRSDSYDNNSPNGPPVGETRSVGGESCAEKPCKNCQNGAGEIKNHPEPRVPGGSAASALLQADLSERVTTCQNALAAARFPTDILVLDFETYFASGYSLSEMPVSEYVADARFHIYGVAIRYPDGTLDFRGDVEDCIEELEGRYGSDLAGVTVVGHNLPFDAYILSTRCGINPKFMLDTLGLARYCYPDMPNSLGDLAQRFGLEAKGAVLDEIKGCRNLTPRQRVDLAAYAKHDVELTYEIATRLSSAVTNSEIELPVVNHTIKLFTERSLNFDVDGARDLLQEINDHLDAKLNAAGIDAKTARSGKKYAELLAQALSASGRSLPMKDGTNGPIPALAKSDEPMLALAEDGDEHVRALVRACLAAKSAPQWINRLTGMIRTVESRGGLPVALQYHGGHTGRFSGAQGSLQNLPGLAKLDVLGPAAKIGTLIVPHRGNRFVYIDLSQVECRILAWLADEQQILDAFREGRDLYSEFASERFGEDVRKPTADDPPAVAQRLRALRAVGKRAILGLGFGMGAERFEGTLKSDPDAAQLFANGMMSSATCEDIVAEYRRTYSNIPAIWRGLEGAFHGAVGAGDGAFGVLRYFQTDAERLACELPSGRTKYYPNVAIDMDGQITFGRGRKLYGGALTENAVQAIARDIFVEDLLKLEAIGLPVIWHCHDGLILEVPECDAEEALRQALQIFRTAPLWAEALPLEADGGKREHFAG